MSFRRGTRSLLAVAVLTTGLVGCADLNGLFKLPGDTSLTDGKGNGGNTITDPGDQLLSNSAATAITDVVATFRDVGALKHMASQQPLLSNSSGNLLSNSAGNLLSNSMSGYRIAATAANQDDYAKIVWTDSNATSWPADLNFDGTFSGTITGTLDGVTVENYSYTVTMSPGAYQREETVQQSAFREKGLYRVTASASASSPEYGGTILVVTGTSTFDPNGLNRQLSYKLDTWGYHDENGAFVALDVKTTVDGLLPNGSDADMTFLYLHELPEETPSQKDRYTLSASGSVVVSGRTLKLDTASVLDGDSLTGDFRLGLAKDFWLRFDFASNTPIVATIRNDQGENLGALSPTADKQKLVIKHPGEEKEEHLDLAVLPELYLLGFRTALPPF